MYHNTQRSCSCRNSIYHYKPLKNDDSQSVEESVRNITRREAIDRGIDHLEPTIGGNTHETNSGMQFLQIEVPKEELWDNEYYRISVNTRFTHIGAKKVSKNIIRDN